MPALSPKDGKTLNETELDAPTVQDGMAAANGRLYLTLKSGEVLCLGQ